MFLNRNFNFIQVLYLRHSRSNGLKNLARLWRKYERRVCASFFLHHSSHSNTSKFALKVMKSSTYDKIIMCICTSFYLCTCILSRLTKQFYLLAFPFQVLQRFIKTYSRFILNILFVKFVSSLLFMYELISEMFNQSLQGVMIYFCLNRAIVL